MSSLTPSEVGVYIDYVASDRFNYYNRAITLKLPLFGENECNVDLYVSGDPVLNGVGRFARAYFRSAFSACATDLLQDCGFLLLFQREWRRYQHLGAERQGVRGPTLREFKIVEAAADFVRQLMIHKDLALNADINEIMYHVRMQIDNLEATDAPPVPFASSLAALSSGTSGAAGGAN